MSPAAPARPRREVDGILLLDKPVGLSSNAALQRARRLYAARKAGHTGSLDPLASGLLPVCFGQATKVSGLLLDADKTYEVRMALGTRTVTGDAEGEIVERASVPELTRTGVEAVAAGFLGPSEQTPPMYSALKHDGRRLYALARQGVEVDREARPIRVHRLDIRRVDAACVDFEVECSKGTYVRSLVEDLARACGTVGHVAKLRRTRLGPFGPEGLHALEQLEQAATEDRLDTLLLPIDAALEGLPEVALGPTEEACVLHGQAVFVSGPLDCRVRMYGPGRQFLGVGRMAPEGRRLAPERLMVRSPPESPHSA